MMLDVILMRLTHYEVNVMQQKYLPILGSLAGLLLLLGGCNRAEPTPAATTVPATATAAEVTPTVAPPDAATTVPTAPPTTVTTDTTTISTTLPISPAGQIEALLFASLQLTVPATDSIGIMGIYAFPLESADDQEFWVAHTVGIRNFDPVQNHVIAIYTPDGDTWREVTRTELAMSDDPADPGVSPDYLGQEGVTQVQVEPAHFWIQVEGGAGAHSGVYGLYSFDGTTLQEEVSGFAASPGVGRIEDLNNDGVAEVLLNASDPYVFCYACGVRLMQWQIQRWDETQMISVTLSALSADAPAAVTAFNDNLLALAQAGLWKDALAALDEAMNFSYTEPALAWNLVYVRVNGEARRDAATPDSAYPLLTDLFYGDYEAAIELLRAVGADGLFISESDLIVGTAAEGWTPTLADWIDQTVNPALEFNPDFAAAYFLRGWGAYVREFDTAAAVADVQKAAELAPNEELYTKSLEFLTE